MFKYLKFIYKNNFYTPNLLSNTEDHRAASTLELFIDLAFVGLLSSLIHFLVGSEHITPSVFYGFLLRYGSTFAIWFNLIWYNNLYENKTMRHRILMLLIIFTTIIQQVSFNADTKLGYHVLLISYVASRLIELFLWLTSTYSKKNTNDLLRKSSIFYIIGIAYSAIVPLLFISDRPNYIIWTTTVIMELILPTVLFHIVVTRAFKKGCTDKIPVHHNLVRERFGLFFLLILGEGILASASIMSHYETNLIGSIIYSLIILVIVYGMWEAYYDITQAEHNKYDEKYMIHWCFLNMILFLSVAMTLGTSSELITPHHAENTYFLSRIHLIGMAIFNICISLSVSIRDKSNNFYRSSFLNKNIKLDTKAINIARISYVTTTFILIFIAIFFKNINEKAIFFTLIAAIQFLFVKQYVAYRSFKLSE